MSTERSGAIAAPELWPTWLPVAEAVAVVCLAVLVALQPRDLGLGARIVLPAVAALACVLEPLTPKVPFWAHAAVVTGVVTILMLHPANIDLAPFFLVLLTGEAAARFSTRKSLLLLGAESVLLVAIEVVGDFDGVAVWILAFAFTWSGVTLLESRHRLIEQLAERAVAEERQRIAAELHDVIAHSLAVTMLQLTGARLALERDPADAAEALAKAEEAGRASLAEIRRAVGLLGPVGAEPMRALPDASDIPALIDEVSVAGLEVEFECDGDLTAVPTATGLSLYRIVQESLANVVKHTPGAAASVVLCIDASEVRLDVRNRRRVAAGAPLAVEQGGMGLQLMRERTSALGGTLRAEPEGDEWWVSVNIPLEQAG